MVPVVFGVLWWNRSSVVVRVPPYNSLQLGGRDSSTPAHCTHNRYHILKQE
jgi:hypothetical protein